MMKRAIVRKNAYYDSVTLMAVSKQVSSLPGVQDVVVCMATGANKELLANVGLLEGEAVEAGPADLVIAFAAENEAAGEGVLAEIDASLKKKVGIGTGERNVLPASLSSALKVLPEANLAVVSLPGQYAAREAMAALKKGLHVMLFSDNVSLDEEVQLKKFAHENGLLLMGPDCGTAIINGKGLCFANAVRPGKTGIVAASGTGAQEVSVLIDRMGGGVTQVIGTGGRDLSREVGGMMMIDALQALQADPLTEVIVLISKPPVKSVSEKVMEQARLGAKPVVVCFLNNPTTQSDEAQLSFVQTLEEAAERAVRLGGIAPAIEIHSPPEMPAFHWAPEQRYLRGLFCGGTLCEEGRFVFTHSHTGKGKVFSNIAKDPAQRLVDPHFSQDHSFVDLGDDTFTVGKPHPMIDPSLRNPRILQEAEDLCTAVILLDFVLGYGSHPDPAGVTLPAIQEAKEKAAQAGRDLAFVAYVCGTDQDPQGREAQEAKLAAAGVILAQSNAQAVRLAAGILEGEDV